MNYLRKPHFGQSLTRIPRIQDLAMSTTSTSTPTAILVSLKFAPVFASHMVALAKALRELGYGITFLVDREYIGFSAFESLGTVVTRGSRVWSGTDSTKPEIVIFMNPALMNVTTALRLKRAGAEVWYMFHEPDALRHYFNQKPSDIIKLAGAKFCSIAMLLVSRGVLLPSQEALRLHLRYFGKYNRNGHVLPLPFDEEIDQSAIRAHSKNRLYFSFLGKASKNHNFSGFLSFVKFALRRECGFKFAIATQSDLASQVESDREIAEYVRDGKLVLQYGRVLSIEEMNHFYLQSFCVWNMYNRVVQSGVLPKSLMAGAAVICPPEASFPEFIISGVNGHFVSSSEHQDGVLQAARMIYANSPAYVTGCRDAFFQIFHFKATSRRLAEILQPESALDCAGCGSCESIDAVYQQNLCRTARVLSAPYRGH
jgi:hypothetical protein